MSLQALLCWKLIGGIFLWSASVKALSPKNSFLLFEKLGLHRCKTFFLYLLIWLEASIGVAVLLGRPEGYLLCLLTGVLLGFVAVLIVMIKKGYRESCSCYGAFIMLTPKEAIKLDLIYLGMVAFVFSQPSAEWNHLKSNPTVASIVGLALVGLGKLRFNKNLDNE